MSGKPYRKMAVAVLGLLALSLGGCVDYRSQIDALNRQIGQLQTDLAKSTEELEALKRPRTRTIRLRVVKNERESWVIDESYHHTPIVRPGDHVVWTCDCPPGAKFAVSDLDFVGDLDKVFDALFPGVAPVAASENCKTLLTDLSEESREQKRPLFTDDWKPPEDFVKGDESIESTTVATSIGRGVWMFRWRVRFDQGLGSQLQGEEEPKELTWPYEPELELDPHIIGDEGG